MQHGIFKRSLLTAAVVAGTCIGILWSNVANAEQIKVDVGLTQPIVVDSSKPLKIALFMRGQNNAGLQAVASGVKERAAELKIPIDVFDANFSASKMVNQMQNALLSDYTAWVVFPPDGSSAVCDMVTKQAPENNILVSINVVHICVDPMAWGDALWAPGTIGFVGGNETRPAFEAIVQKAIDDHPGPVKVGIVHGLKLNPVAKSLLKAVDEKAAKNKNFQVVVKVESDWQTPEALAKATTMFQANPDLDVVITQFTAMTRGVLAAIQTSGIDRKIDVYELGGTQWSADMIKEGKIKATLPWHFKTNGAASVDNINAVYHGAPIPKFSPNDGFKSPDGSDPSAITIIDSSNVGTFKAEFN